MGRIFVGKGLLYLAAAFIAVSYLYILYIEGVWKLWEIASPFQVWHALASLLIKGVAIMLPGIALIGVGKMLGDDYQPSTINGPAGTPLRTLRRASSRSI